MCGKILIKNFTIPRRPGIAAHLSSECEGSCCPNQDIFVHFDASSINVSGRTNNFPRCFCLDFDERKKFDSTTFLSREPMDTYFHHNDEIVIYVGSFHCSLNK